MWQERLIASHVNHSNHKLDITNLVILEPIHIYKTDGYEFFKVPFSNGTTLGQGSVAETCANAKMKAVCNGDSRCPENSGSCSVTPLSSACGNCVLDELSKRICNHYDPRNCKELEGVFSYNGLSGGECGIVNGSYFSHGKTYVSGDPDVFHALCVDCHGANCSGKC